MDVDEHQSWGFKAEHGTKQLVDRVSIAITSS